MSSGTDNSDRAFLNLFNKIKLLDSIATRLVFYGMKYGNEQFMDYVDLNCGAIPEGDYEQIIDPSAPYQFLSLYVQIAENRFAFAVTELLKMDSGFINPIRDFCYTVGKDMNVESVDSLKIAFDIVKSFVLDGMQENESFKIIEDSDDRFVWKKDLDTHKAAWNKAGGELSVYYELQKCFVNGLLCSSKINYRIENFDTFILAKNSIAHL